MSFGLAFERFVLFLPLISSSLSETAFIFVTLSFTLLRSSHLLVLITSPLIFPFPFLLIRILLFFPPFHSHSQLPTFSSPFMNHLASLCLVECSAEVLLSVRLDVKGAGDVVGEESSGPLRKHGEYTRLRSHSPEIIHTSPRIPTTSKPPAMRLFL
ncbi:hypothetical protein BDQ17DRAFT_1547507 [Cyathus striatus]|nr:hypothetical protein BDQ17DRAFT_1547507 [Cyathus striatus]